MKDSGSGLGIEVYHDGFLAGRCTDSSKVTGNGSFSDATFFKISIQMPLPLNHEKTALPTPFQDDTAIFAMFPNLFECQVNTGVRIHF